MKLKHEPHGLVSKRRKLLVGSGGQRLSADLDETASRLVERTKEMQKCALAGAARADDATIRRANLEVDAVEDGDRGTVAAEVHLARSTASNTAFVTNTSTG